MAFGVFELRVQGLGSQLETSVLDLQVFVVFEVLSFIGLGVSRDEDLQGLVLIGSALDPRLFW